MIFPIPTLEAPLLQNQVERSIIQLYFFFFALPSSLFLTLLSFRLFSPSPFVPLFSLPLHKPALTFSVE